MFSNCSFLSFFKVDDKLFEHVICCKTDATFIKGFNESHEAVLLYSVNADAVVFELVNEEYVHIGKINLVYKDDIWTYEPNDKSKVDSFKDLKDKDLIRLECLIFKQMLTEKLTTTVTSTKEL